MAIWQPDSTWTDAVQEGDAAASTWQSWWLWLARMWEVETARIAIWSPVFLVGGIWTYFGLSKEPPLLLAAALTIATFVILVFYRHKKLLLLLALLALGFAAAQWRTQWVATPLLRSFSPGIKIEGYVVDSEQRGKSRQRILLSLNKAEGMPQEELPRRVQLQVNAKANLPKVGAMISVTADMAPLPRPSMPGSFDFGRQLYFQSVGATARTKTPPQFIDQPVPWEFRLRRSLHEIRNAIGARITSAIPGPIGAFADALITGERTAIPRAMINSLQASGLFHILSISGLHMSLVAGGAFWVVRALLALSPALTLRYPIKKWAAAFAMFLGFAYMLLADGGAATERSFIMIAVVFFAVMVDRPALSLHNLSIAAMLILLSAPEQALAASFQMSFMAVMGLAAFFAWWQRVIPNPVASQNKSAVQRYARKAVLLIVASLATSLVAGTLSSIPAAHHFGRLAPYSVVANALALPIVAIIVMPMAMLSVLLMPLGLEALPLQAMELGLKLVMLISDWVASWPSAGAQLPRIAAPTAVLLALAAASLCLPTTRLRVLALPLLCAAIVSMTISKQPDILIDERAANVAINSKVGLVPAEGARATYSVGRWLKEFGDGVSAKKAALREGWTCAAGACTATIENWQVAFLRETAGNIKPCPKVDILIASYPLRFRCKGKFTTIDRFDVWRQGAQAIWLDGENIIIKTVRQTQGERPWVYQPRARAKQ